MVAGATVDRGGGLLSGRTSDLQSLPHRRTVQAEQTSRDYDGAEEQSKPLGQRYSPPCPGSRRRYHSHLFRAESLREQKRFPPSKELDPDKKHEPRGHNEAQRQAASTQNLHRSGRQSPLFSAEQPPAKP